MAYHEKVNKCLAVIKKIYEQVPGYLEQLMACTSKSTGWEGVGALQENAGGCASHKIHKLHLYGNGKKKVLGFYIRRIWHSK